MTDIRARLCTLWIAVLFNMIYADLLGFLILRHTWRWRAPERLTERHVASGAS